MTIEFNIVAVVCVATASGSFLGSTITCVVMRRKQAQIIDKWADLCRAKYDEGYQAHKLMLMRQMSQSARTHVPHDEGEPRPITVHKRQLRVKTLPKLPGRN